MTSESYEKLKNIQDALVKECGGMNLAPEALRAKLAAVADIEQLLKPPANVMGERPRTDGAKKDGSK